MTKRALAEITVEAPATDVSKTLKGFMPSIGISFERETAQENPHRIELVGFHHISMRT